MFCRRLACMEYWHYQKQYFNIGDAFVFFPDDVIAIFYDRPKFSFNAELLVWMLHRDLWLFNQLVIFA